MKTDIFHENCCEWNNWLKNIIECNIHKLYNYGSIKCEHCNKNLKNIEFTYKQYHVDVKVFHDYFEHGIQMKKDITDMIMNEFLPNDALSTFEHV